VCGDTYPSLLLVPSPNQVSKYCKRLGQRQAKTVIYHKTEPCLTVLSNWEETPKEHCLLGQRNWTCVEGGRPICLPTLARPLREGVKDSKLGACPLQFDF
jgi:hypothetical protein